MKWSPELDSVIRSRYPTEGSGIAAELKLTREQVRKRAMVLGVKHQGSNGWMKSFYRKKHGKDHQSCE